MISMFYGSNSSIRLLFCNRGTSLIYEAVSEVKKQSSFSFYVHLFNVKC